MHQRWICNETAKISNFKAWPFIKRNQQTKNSKNRQTNKNSKKNKQKNKLKTVKIDKQTQSRHTNRKQLLQPSSSQTNKNNKKQLNKQTNKHTKKNKKERKLRKKSCSHLVMFLAAQSTDKQIKTIKKTKKEKRIRRIHLVMFLATKLKQQSVSHKLDVGCLNWDVKEAAAFEAPSQTKEEFSGNDTSRHPKLGYQ